MPVLTCLQWNIGGGLVRAEDTKPDAEYDRLDIGYLAELIRQHEPDIVTLQETHADEYGSIPQQLAEALGYTEWRNDTHGASHLTKGQNLGIGVLSRHPIVRHEFRPIIAPEKMVVFRGRPPARLHNKGMTSTMIELPGATLQLGNTHQFSFRIMNESPYEPQHDLLRETISDFLRPGSGPYVFQGDFNVNDSTLQKFLPQLFAAGVQEVARSGPTTPENHYYDHVLYRGLDLVKTEIRSDVLTDHYPVISQFTYTAQV